MVSIPINAKQISSSHCPLVSCRRAIPGHVSGPLVVLYESLFGVKLSWTRCYKSNKEIQLEFKSEKITGGKMGSIVIKTNMPGYDNVTIYTDLLSLHSNEYLCHG